MGKLSAAIETLRAGWGGRLRVLCHPYQPPAVLRHADFTGDTRGLLRQVASDRAAERFVFCGMRFQAESAALLSAPAQSVYLPDAAAGCPLADTADPDQVEEALCTIEERAGDWIAVVHVNSPAATKAVCGRRGGVCCTAGNAARIVRRALERGRRVFFLPDENLGRNAIREAGIEDGAVLRYIPGRPGGGLPLDRVAAARAVLWAGCCNVHGASTAEAIRRVREALPAARVAVHAAAPPDAARLADARGSSAQIADYVDSLPDGTVVAIGAETSLVEGLARRHEGRLAVKLLHATTCSNMARTNERALLDLLTNWPAECRVRVPESLAADARAPLLRMMEWDAP